MNNKGQALVEFVLILPVFILMLFVIIDFGMIINTKNDLENNSVDIIGMVKNGESIDEIEKVYNDININVIDDNKYIKVIISDEINIMTPGLNRILDNPYVVKVERFVYND